MSDIEIRNARLMERVKQEPKTPLTKIAEDGGISTERLRQIMRENGVTREKGTGERKPYHMMEPVSRLHLQIGQDVSYHKSKLNLSQKELAQAAKMSTQRLRGIELGVIADLTVTEMIRLARACEISVEYLTTERTAGMKERKEAS